MIKKLDKRYKVTFLVLTFIFACVLTIGVSYAYFTMTVTGEGETTTVKSGKVVMNLTDGPKVVASNLMPGESLVKTFTVNNMGSMSATYTVYLSKVLNLLSDKNDIVYKLESTDANIDSEDVFPTNNKAILEDQRIDAGETHHFNLTITYLDTEENQKDNMNKYVTGTLAVNEAEPYANNTPYEQSGVEVTNVVENVEALKASNASIGDIIETAGYFEANDGGAAYYDIKQYNSQTVDNGMYIRLDNGNVAQLKILNNAINLKQFGAKGDGVTDDKTAITTAAKRANGKVLYVPSGTYMVSDIISLGSMNNFTLVGDGPTSMFKASPTITANKPLIYFGESSNVVVSSMAFDGNLEENTEEEGYTGSSGIRFIGTRIVSNMIFDNITFSNTAGEAIRLSRTANNVFITNNIFDNVNVALSHNENNSIENLFFEYNTINLMGTSSAVQLTDAATLDNVEIHYNTINNGPNNGGIYLMGGGQINTLNNINITHNTLTNVGSGISVKNGNNITIKDNNIDTMALTNGIYLYLTNNAEITNNTINKTSQRGIYIYGCNYVNIHDNTITDSGTINNNYFFVDIRDVNSNIEFYNNTLERKDNNLYQYVMVIHGNGGIRVYDNTFTNGKIWLYSDTSNIYVANNGTYVLNNGTNNTIID